MIGPWLEIAAPLEVCTPLHIGSGATGLSSGIAVEDPDDRERRSPVEIGLVAADAEGYPVIPGSSLKGAWRAAMPQTAKVDTLMGPLSIGEDDDARAGLLVVWMAKLDRERLPRVAGAPFADTGLAVDPQGFPVGGNRHHGEFGLFVEARTAIDPAFGVADEGKLFHRQMVAPGARFNLRLGVALREGEDGRIATDALKRLAEGISLGAGSALDAGRVRMVTEDLVARRHVLARGDGLRCEDVSDQWRQRLKQAAAPAPAIASIWQKRIRLVGEGPFLVNDSSRSRNRQKPSSDEERTPQLEGLRDFPLEKDKPQLPAASLLGALRARAVWLCRVDRRAHEDRRDLSVGPDEIGTLSATERLFGVSGWRGLLRLENVVCEKHAGWQGFASVKLDRMSGAPVHGGLFTLQASVDPVFSLDIALEHRGDWPSTEDRSLAEELLKDLKDNGIALGHATNRGFGWFKVEICS